MNQRHPSMADKCMLYGLILLLHCCAAVCEDSTTPTLPSVDCEISYIAQDQIYLNAGHSIGIEQGCRGQILRQGNAIARVEVQFVSSSSSACTLLTGSIQPVIGDRVQLFLREKKPVNTLDGIPEEEDQLAVRNQAADSTTRTDQGMKRNRLSGRWSAAHQGLLGTTASKGERTHSRLSLRWTGSQGLQARFHGRLRKTHGYESATNGLQVAEVVVSGMTSLEAIRWQAGRIGPRSGLTGRMDGLGISSDRELLDWGLLVGSSPDQTENSIRTDQPAFGAWLGLTNRKQGWKLRATGQGRYGHDTSDREWLDLSGSWLPGRGPRLTGEAKVDLRRGGQRDPGQKALEVTSIHLGSDWQLHPNLSGRIVYRTDRLYSSVHDESGADSLIHAENREGLRTQMIFRKGLVQTSIWAQWRGVAASGRDFRLVGVTGRLRQLPGKVEVTVEAVQTQRDSYNSWRISSSLRRAWNSLSAKLEAGYHRSDNPGSYYMHWQRVVCHAGIRQWAIGIELDREQQPDQGPSHRYTLQVGRAIKFKL